eukprot:9379989-Alexandrium_andersonii.AAC.1
MGSSASCFPAPPERCRPRTQGPARPPDAPRGGAGECRKHCYRCVATHSQPWREMWSASSEPLSASLNS